MKKKNLIEKKDDKKDKKEKKKDKKDKKAKLEAPRELAPLGAEKTPFGLSPAMQAAQGRASVSESARSNIMEDDNDDSRESSAQLGESESMFDSRKQSRGLDD